MKPFAACVVVAMALSAVVGCNKKEDTQPPVATATFSASRAKAPLGSPLDLTYRFVVAANAPAFDKEYRVLVHFLDSDDQLMWTDDHFPTTSTKEWKPGQRIEYTRTMFVPQYPYMGQATIRIGLYDPETGARLPLGGENDGQRAYKAGTIELLPAADNVFIQFKDGWHNAEVAAENAQVEWQWTKKRATLALRNPRRDATFFLHFPTKDAVLAEYGRQVTDDLAAFLHDDTPATATLRQALGFLCDRALEHAALMQPIMHALLTRPAAGLPRLPRQR